MSNGGSGGSSGGGSGGGSSSGGFASALGAIGGAFSIASGVIGIAGFGISLAQAAKQKRKASQAKADSERLMQQARTRMEKDAYENIKLPTESYDRAFKANTAQQRQALEALQGADARTLAAGVGKVGALGTASNEQQRLQMGKDLFALELTKAKNQERIKDELVGMDVGQAADQMKMAQDQDAASVASIGGGIQSLTSGLAAVGQAAPLYGQKVDDRRAGKLMEDPVVAEQRSNLTGKPIMKTVDGVTKQVTNDAGELHYEAINDSFVRQALIDAGLTRKRKMEIPDDFDLQTYYNAYIN